MPESVTRNIIALGGGGFSTDPGDLRLEEYVLSTAHNARPRICFLPTASGDSTDYIDRFYNAFNRLPCVPSVLSLFHPATSDLRGHLLNQDVIYVGGGNTRNMLAMWREWELDLALVEAWKSGVVMAGISAGANCWFEKCVTDSNPGRLSVMACLGVLPGAYCPHYELEAARRAATHRLMLAGEMNSCWAVDDGVALHFVGSEFSKAIGNREEARAFHVSTGIDGQMIESPIAISILN